uniref:N/A n=1 Tax=Ganoderma boninense TaxID=34458 RepID=A0A5K1K234_9APHY|nr:N/A [Ganoderma boninense]
MALSPLHPSRTFWFENQCFTVINPSRVDFLPGIRVGDPDQNLTARDLRKAVWAIDKSPEMAYMLRSSHSDSSLLLRLNCDPRKPPIVTTEKKRYALSEDVLTAWMDLEQSLYAVSETLLLHISKIPEAKFPFDAFWPLPSECGYRKEHPTFQSARKAVLRSRDAFFLLASRCTLAIALFQYRFPAEDPPAWTCVLMDRGVPAPWIDELRASPIADLSSGIRVGAFIDPLPGPACTVWMTHIPCMIAANLPTYIAWPTLNGRLDASLCGQILRDHPCLATYLPSSADEAPIVPTLADPKAFQPFFRWTDIVQDSRPSPAGSPFPTHSAEVLSGLPHGPGQRPGETCQQFFSRREAEGKRRTEAETAENRAKRLQRAANAASYSCPVRPTTTFLWIEVGDVDGGVPWYLLQSDYRKVVRFSAVRDLWKMYPDSHKRYDPWRDEWDICPKLSDEPLVDDLSDDDENFGFPLSIPQQPPDDNPLSLPGPATIAHSFQADLQRLYGAEEFAGHVFVSEGFEKIAYYRYGVVLGAPLVPQQGPEYSAFNRANVQKYFGLLTTDIHPAGLHVPALSAFLSVTLDRSTNGMIPATVWDLDHNCPQYLLKVGQANPTLRLDLWKLSGVEYYRVRYEGEPDCWFDVLVGPMTAVELLRRGYIHSRASAIELMVQNGVAFRTPYYLDRRDMFSPRLSPFGDALGWRPRGFTATRYDYGQYIAQAYQVLHQPRGRAAVLYGGIVWRLALEILGSDAAGRAVTGPSEDVFHFGQEFLPRQGDALYDDSLTPGEIDIVCGVYKLPTQDSKPELLSWWPRPNVFNTSGLAFGYWTPWCESWFQRRIARIKAGCRVG